MDDLRECYRLLEVEAGAELEAVKSSYRELVKVWHPDRFSHDPKLREKAVEKLKQINLAYERICAEGASYRPADDDSDNSFSRRQRYERRDDDYEYETRRDAPAEGAPPPPPPADVWRQRLKAAAAAIGAVAIVALVIYLYPEPEPRFLVELPPEPTIPMMGVEQPQPPRAGGERRRAAVAPQPTFALPPSKFFSVGSTKEEVIAAQGRPDSATETLFRYGTSDVHFENDKVTSWRNGFPRLKIKMAAAPNLGGRTYFTIGSTKDQVIDAQGTPDSFTDTSFTYGTSKVYFEAGRVKSWRARRPPLNVKMLPEADIGSPTHFSVGSTKDEVLAAQGTPDSFTESEFNYGTSKVFFDRGKVTSWDSRHPALRVGPPG